MESADRIAGEVAERVRELVADAERRAAEIVGEAEAEAKRIRERAEAEGNERLAEVRRVLAELEGKLAVSGASAEVEPGPVTVPEPTPAPVPEPTPSPVPEPAPEPVPEPTPERIPEPMPPPDEGTPPPETSPDPGEAEAGPATNGGAGGRSSDATAARLVAMNMALGGSTREEIDATLAAGYDIDDRAGLIDDVLAKAGG